MSGIALQSHYILSHSLALALLLISANAAQPNHHPITPPPLDHTISLAVAQPPAITNEPGSYTYTAPPPPHIQPLPYRLTDESFLVDECTICGRPLIIVPIQGRFFLALAQKGPLYDTFTLQDLHFSTPSPYPDYIGRFEGSYRLGGEFALQQQMTLVGSITVHNQNFPHLTLQSSWSVPQIRFPWIKINLTQTDPVDPLHTFHLQLLAVPAPTIWFSTERPFTTSTNPKSSISPGDLVDSAGQLVATNNKLTARLGIMPLVPDIGLDALLLPAADPPMSLASFCQLWFSSQSSIFSETLGWLDHGDTLAVTGTIAYDHHDLLSPFQPLDPPDDLGLDALAVSPSGQLLFSTNKDFFAQALGKVISHGDLLSSSGQIYKTNAQLLANFHPIDPRPIPFGLDAVFVWPHGEIWFSIDANFTDLNLGPIQHGDLLSDIGRIVARNAELLQPFAPTQAKDFGLDALQLILPTSDLNHDRKITFADFALFAHSWLSPDCPARPLCDLNYDRLLDHLDLQQFAHTWLTDPLNPTCPQP